MRGTFRRGMALVYIAVVATIFVGLMSLAVDYGRVQLAKTQLLDAADAAARAGVASIPSGVSTAQAVAIQAASENLADGTSVALDASDIEFGTWDASSKTFTVLTGAARSNANAMRVTARRTAATNNAIPLYFGAVVGQHSCDVHASAIAMIQQKHLPVGIIGLNSVSFVQSSLADSYSSSGAATSGYNARVMSNGDISYGGSTYIHGDATPGPGHSVTAGASKISGSTAPATTTISAPPALASPYSSTNNDNASIPAGYVSGGNFTLSGGSVTIPPGNYYFNDFTMYGGSTLNVSGKVNIYIAGTLSMSQSAQTGNFAPSNLNFKVISSNAVDLSNSNDIRMTLYAPLSDVSIGNSKQVYGSVVGKTLAISSSVQMHFDEDLLSSGTSSADITSVK
jgi:hypothetical protein